MQSGFSIPEKPYGAIASPYVMMSERKKEGDTDLNVISTAGITIGSNCTYEGDKIKEEVVTVDFSKFQATYNHLSLEVIAEATLECIRRTATDEHQQWRRPVLKIIAKPTDEAMLKPCVDAFNKQDFSKPFKRPLALQNRIKGQVIYPTLPSPHLQLPPFHIHILDSQLLHLRHPQPTAIKELYRQPGITPHPVE